jgi:hypothetical protein
MSPPRMYLHAAFGWWGQKSKRVMEAATTHVSCNVRAMAAFTSTPTCAACRWMQTLCEHGPRTEAVATLAAGFG